MIAAIAALEILLHWFLGHFCALKYLWIGWVDIRNLLVGGAAQSMRVRPSQSHRDLGIALVRTEMLRGWRTDWRWPDRDSNPEPWECSGMLLPTKFATSMRIVMLPIWERCCGKCYGEWWRKRRYGMSNSGSVLSCWSKSVMPAGYDQLISSLSPSISILTLYESQNLHYCIYWTFKNIDFICIGFCRYICIVSHGS